MIIRGVPLPSIVFYLTSVDTGYFVWGGGGCGVVIGYYVLCFVYCYFGFSSMSSF